MTDKSIIEQAFDRARAELGVRTEFPDEVISESERLATEGGIDERHTDRTEIPFITIDPPGSQDLDQALQIERDGNGFRVRYAIADVGSFVPRGSLVEEEAWQRGVTFYSPDQRDPLYPPALGHGAASLLPDVDRPAVLFEIELDARGKIGQIDIARAKIRSRAQLNYTEALGHVEENAPAFEGEPWRETLTLLREVGELRMKQERERGGVSLPIPEQHVQQRTARRLGYELVYEDPNVAEEWNAQISLLTGHVAATKMLEAHVGLLRRVAAADPGELEKFRVAARELGFDWPDGTSYAEFLHQIDAAQDKAEIVVWQARGVMRGADYVAFAGELPKDTLHHALAMSYAHCTAPLRRLADRYVLDLLLTLTSGERPSDQEIETLQALPPVMAETARRASRLERRMIEIAEAAALAGSSGTPFDAVVLEASADRIEIQIAEPPVRARIDLDNGSGVHEPGSRVQVRATRADVLEGHVDFETVPIS